MSTSWGGGVITRISGDQEEREERREVIHRALIASYWGYTLYRYATYSLSVGSAHRELSGELFICVCFHKITRGSLAGLVISIYLKI